MTSPRRCGGNLLAEPDPHLLPLLFLDSRGAVLRAVPVQAKDVHGQAVDVTFAEDMTGIGDLDGDGLSEVAIGFPFDDNGGEERGAVWIAFLARDGSVRAKTKLSAWSGNPAGIFPNKAVLTVMTYDAEDPAASIYDPGVKLFVDEAGTVTTKLGNEERQPSPR